MNSQESARDWELIQLYSKSGSQQAFQQLMERHLSLVYSTALREVKDSHMAEDITQIVFLLLSKKAARMNSNVSLPGWLFKTTRFISKDVLKKEEKRVHQEVPIGDNVENITTEDGNLWKQIEPHFHDALSTLASKERDALVIHFFQDKNFRETGQLLGVSEDAARMRVNRALEKLRSRFKKQHSVLPLALLSTLLKSEIAKASTPQLTHVTQNTLAQLNASQSANHYQLQERLQGVERAMKIKTMKGIAVAVGISCLTAGSAALVVANNSAPDTRNVAATTATSKKADANVAAMLAGSWKYDEVNSIGQREIKTIELSSDGKFTAANKDEVHKGAYSLEGDTLILPVSEMSDPRSGQSWSGEPVLTIKFKFKVTENELRLTPESMTAEGRETMAAEGQEEELFKRVN